MNNEPDGLADDATLNQGTTLYHGSLAEEFTHRWKPYPLHFSHPATPDSPAWFADNQNFSLHAAMRYTEPGEKGRIVLHKFTVGRDLKMMYLLDIPNFRVFMQQMFDVDGTRVNGMMEGIELARWSNEPFGLDGYGLRHDAVRGEPEFVLFAAGLKALKNGTKSIIQVVPINGQQSKLVDEVTNKQVAIYTYDNGPGTLT